MAEKIYLYPLWIRIWHVFNALFFLTLLATGISMQYSSPDWPLIPFDISVAAHNVAGVCIALTYVVFLVYTRFSRNRIHYQVMWKGLMPRVMKQAMYYTFGVFRKQEPPFPISEEMKFNPLQQITYVMVMYAIVPVLIITGLALMFPEVIIDDIYGIGGTLLTALIHVSAGFFASMFLIIHLYFSTMGASLTSNFKSIVNGYHEPH